MDITNKTVAVITGAASGIGRALAEALAARGCRLVLADRDLSGLERFAAELGLDESRLMLRQVDVSDRAALQALARDSEQLMGPAQLVINNAGVALCQSVVNQDDADLEWVMGINFWGMVHGARAYLPQLMEQGAGTVVFISSILGIIGAPTQSAYTASKFAIRGYAESMRQEVAENGVGVLVVCPGGVKTNIARNGRMDEWGAAIPMGSGDPVSDFDQLARTTPEVAARIILKAVERDRSRVLVGADARWMDRLARLFPSAYASLWQRLMRLGTGL